jgi:hypothetical protein
MSRARRVVGGSVGGVLGSVLMAVPVLAAREMGLIGTPPPERITEGLLHRAGLRVDSDTEDRLAALLHVGFGAVAGALYGATAPRVRDVPRALAIGIGYAGLVYAVSYAGWVPGLGLLPPPHRDQRVRQGVMVAAHVLYGTAIALATLAANGDEDSPSDDPPVTTSGKASAAGEETGEPQPQGLPSRR